MIIGINNQQQQQVGSLTYLFNYLVTYQSNKRMAILIKNLRILLKCINADNQNLLIWPCFTCMKSYR